jgi:hypothetical protein
LLLHAPCLMEKQQILIFIVFDLARLEIDPIIFRPRDDHANYYTYVVVFVTGRRHNILHFWYVALFQFNKKVYILIRENIFIYFYMKFVCRYSVRTAKSWPIYDGAAGSSVAWQKWLVSMHSCLQSNKSCGGENMM